MEFDRATISSIVLANSQSPLIGSAIFNNVTDVTNPQGGSIAIAAQNLDLENSSPRIRAGVARGTSILPSGNIYIDVVDRLSISTGGFINRVDSRTGVKSGVSGEINITAGSIILRNENVVSPNVFAACQCLKCTSG